MKKKSLLLLYLASFILLCSCYEDKRTTFEGQSSPIEMNDTANRKDSQTDTLKTDSTRSVSEDTVKVNAVIPAKPISQEDGSPSFWEILALGFSSMSLVFCIVIWCQIRRMGKDVSYEMRETERNNKENLHAYNDKIVERCSSKMESICSKMQNDMKQLSERVSRLESSEMPLQQDSRGNKIELEQSEPKMQGNKRGYFGMVKVGDGIALFNDYLKSRNEGAYFEVVYLDDDHCEFSPIDLDRIRSIDAVSEAVEYNGDMAYAKSMKVLKKGKAVLDKERKFWRITDKSIIELKN